MGDKFGSIDLFKLGGVKSLEYFIQLLKENHVLFFFKGIFYRVRGVSLGNVSLLIVLFDF